MCQDAGEKKAGTEDLVGRRPKQLAVHWGRRCREGQSWAQPRDTHTSRGLSSGGEEPGFCRGDGEETTTAWSWGGES